MIDFNSLIEYFGISLEVLQSYVIFVASVVAMLLSWLDTKSEVKRIGKHDIKYGVLYTAGVSLVVGLVTGFIPFPEIELMPILFSLGRGLVAGIALFGLVTGQYKAISGLFGKIGANVHGVKIEAVGIVEEGWNEFGEILADAESAPPAPKLGK